MMLRETKPFGADYGENYFIAPIPLFIDRFGVYPSVSKITNFFDLDALLEYIKTKTEEKMIGSYVKSREKSLQLADGYIVLKIETGGIALFLEISQASIPKEIPEDEYEWSPTTRTPKVTPKLSNHFKMSISVYFDSETISLSEVEKLMTEISQFKVEPKRQSELKFLCKDSEGFVLKTLEMNVPAIDIKLNYGKGFETLYEYICERMGDEKGKSKGLVLLHGVPGSGKTYLIRKLIHDLSEKKQIIYIPPDMAYELSNPAFLPFLMENQNSILIIEDGENIIRSRKGGQNQAVANLLNVADGLLSDALNIQIICTFNCKIGEVDDALLRKGRLIAQHEFQALSIEDSQTLLNHLEIVFTATKPMTLADIYNCKDLGFVEERKSVGF